MLPTIPYPEIVIALCSPIGTNNAAVSGFVKAALSAFGYQTHTIKVTTVMRSIGLKGQINLDDSDVGTRYDTSIRYANRLRDAFQMQYVLAILCIAAIRSYRRSTGKSDQILERTAFIIDQFKRPEEIEALRQIYGTSFISISVFSSRQRRLESLVHRFTSDRSHAKAEDEDKHAAETLIARDEEERDVPTGQRLRDAFALADVFINLDQVEDAEMQISRFFRAFFGSNKVSPTKSEYGLYLAHTASLRTLDLSRQVGAAIMTEDGEVISLGSNEVPKAGGGTYWCDDLQKLDARDYTRGRDENEHIKRGILADLIRRLIKGGFIEQPNEDSTTGSLVARVIARSKIKGSEIRESLVMDLLEFGRVIHAEMSAITDAARRGLPTKNMYLYCTTFPCHMCAKHIVAAGIKRVIFIEPFPKSYAEQLHDDSIEVSASFDENCSKVTFSPFMGISPRRYREVFKRASRKDFNGNFMDWEQKEPRPRANIISNGYMSDEKTFMKLFESKAKTLTTDGVIEISGLDVV